MAGKKGGAGGGGRKRKSKKTGDQAKELQAAATSEAPRLNIPAPRDLKHHYDTILGFKAKLDEANGRLRNAFKQAEEAGVDTAGIRFAMSKSKKDPLVLKAFLLQVAEHFKELGLPFQISLFDTINGTPDEQAYKAGYAIGEGGQTPANPYPAGSPPNDEYNRGVAHGIGKNLGQTPEQVDAALAADGGPDRGDGGGTEVWPDDQQVRENVEDDDSEHMQPIGEPVGSA